MYCISYWDELKNAVAAAESDAMVAFVRAHVDTQIAAGVWTQDGWRRSLAAQVGLACRVSPTEGHRLHIARDLHPGQIMAEILVERLTGQPAPTSSRSKPLLDPTSPLPAQLPGHGPAPMERILTGTQAIRRLLTRDGIVVGDDSRQRAFTGALPSSPRPATPDGVGSPPATPRSASSTTSSAAPTTGNGIGQRPRPV